MDGFDKLAALQAQVESAEQALAPLPSSIQNSDFKKVCFSSEFFTQSVISRSDIACELFSSGDLDTVYVPNTYLKKLEDIFNSITPQTDLHQVLREFRRREMMRIVWRSLSHAATLLETLSDLSNMADAILIKTINYVSKKHQEKYGVPQNKYGQPQSLQVICLGKLGGSELNFSSDIDLICVYPEAGMTSEGESNENFFKKLLQKLLKALTEVTKDGFVYRVDLRLRPFGDSGPMIMNYNALNTYYQEQGRGWERYALIKARLLPLGTKQERDPLQKIIRRFVYRRYVDYSAIDALRSLKHLIELEVKMGGLEDNIKRGAGGIRQIEFIAQTFQLVQGGQDHRLQKESLLDVLPCLEQLGFLNKQIVKELKEAYEFLRVLENCIQMIADRQTHDLPSQLIDQQRLCLAMDFSHWSDLKKTLNDYRKRVNFHFENMLSSKDNDISAEKLSQEELHALWQGQIGTTSSLILLEQLGFTENEAALERMEHFRSSRRVRILTSEARQRLDQLIPCLLVEIGQQEHSQILLSRVILLLENIAQRSAYLSLLLENPNTIPHLIQLFVSSAWIAEIVSLHPLLLTELLVTEALYAPTPQSELRQELDTIIGNLPEPDFENKIDALRQFKLRQTLRVAAAETMSALPLMNVSDHLTFTAIVIINKLCEILSEHMLEKYPQAAQENLLPTKNDFAIIAYGKLGGIEISYGSDLDIVFLHTKSKGEDQYVLRFAQRLIHLLSMKTASGVLYSVDTRLRPSGSAGLLVSQMDAFIDYQREQAWTWEHQALVRARIIYGSAELIQKFNQARADILGLPRDVKQLREDVVVMRAKMLESAQSLPKGVIDIKHCQGGMTDIEFIVQFIVLAHAKGQLPLIKYTDNIRLLDAIEELKLCSAQTCRALREIYVTYRQAQHRLLLAGKETYLAEDLFEKERNQVQSIWKDVLLEEK